MPRRYFRTNVSGKAKVFLVDENHYKNTRSLCADLAGKFTGNKEIDALVSAFSGIVETLDRKLEDIRNRLDGCEVNNNQLSDIEITDISGSGIRLLLNEKINKGQLLFIRLEIFDYPQRYFEAYGELVRISLQQTKTGEKYCAGVKFINLESEKREKLINYIFQQQRKHIRAIKNNNNRPENNTRISVG